MNLLDPDDRAYADEQEAAAHSDPPAEQPDPEHLTLSGAAGMVLAFLDADTIAEPAKIAALAVWSALVALPDAEAVAFARSIAAEDRIVLAHRSPF